VRFFLFEVLLQVCPVIEVNIYALDVLHEFRLVRNLTLRLDGIILHHNRAAILIQWHHFSLWYLRFSSLSSLENCAVRSRVLLNDATLVLVSTLDDDAATRSVSAVVI
jgi:hypothetical protein